MIFNLKLPINLTVFASLLFFVVVGIAFVPQAGIEDDEAMIVSGMYIQEGFAQRIKIFGYDTPVMFMSYVGALKSWIYTPIFALWKPSPATLRVPVILISALTIWIFYRWLLRIASRRAALIGCVLLSTDTIFLMTSYFDWGPVVLQHFLSVSGAFFVVRFHQTRQLWFLAAGFFQFGLGMWDKAVFIWILCGMAVAAVVVFPKEVWRCLRPSSLAVATLSFCLGSAPLIFYNVSFPLETFRSTATYSTNQFPEKCRNVAGALSGQALFGYLTRFDPAGHPRRGQSAIEQVSIRLSEIAGHPVSGFLGYALMVALLLTPFLWSTPVRRPFIFSAIAMLVAWLQMLFTRGAGASPHHVVLVWPFPVLLVAIGFAEASRCLGRIGDQLLVYHRQVLSHCRKAPPSFCEAARSLA